MVRVGLYLAATIRFSLGVLKMVKWSVEASAYMIILAGGGPEL